MVKYTIDRRGVLIGRFPADFPKEISPSVKRVYPWTQTYSSEQYIKLLNTYSGHIALPDENKRLLFEGIVDLIETKYDGQITKHYEAVLDLRETQ